MYNDRMLGLSLELLFRLWFSNYFDGPCPSSVRFFVVEFEPREQVVNSGVYGCRLITPFLFPSWEHVSTRTPIAKGRLLEALEEPGVRESEMERSREVESTVGG